MGVQSFKPVTPTRRYYSQADFSELTKKKPEKRLLRSRPSSGGRNTYGRITSRFRGGGHKRRYRIVDFKRDKADIPGKVAALEYDPNRSARLALIHYADGEKRYILAPHNLKVGATIISSEKADIQIGNTLPLNKIPTGTNVHNIELKIGAGGKLVRTAGGMAQVLGFDGGYAQLRMPSSEIRRIPEGCRATIGQVGNLDHENIVLGKAGRSRWLGRRPHNRGVTMNPVDHPHGGGEGRTSGGRHPVSPWGWSTKGKKYRNNKRTDRFIIRARKKKKRG